MQGLQSYVAGFFAIVVAVITWQLESEFVQSIQEPSSPNYYNKPYFLVWFLSGGYMIFLPMWLVMRVYNLRKENVAWSRIPVPSVLLQREERWVIKLGMISSVPYFLCGYFFYLSLAHTSVTANTVIYDSAFVFIFLFSVLMLREKFSMLKITSVAVSFVGLLIVVWAGSQSLENGVDQTLLGYVLVFVSTILCSLYDVIYKKFGTRPQDAREKIEQEMLTEAPTDAVNKVIEAEDIPLSSSLLFQGALGLITVVAYWPGLILLNWSGFEVFEWPTWDITKILLLNMLLDSTNSIAFLLAINWTTPLFVGIGSLLNIPVSVFLDIVIHSYLLPWWGFIGVACIVVGFFMLTLADYYLNKREPCCFVRSLLFKNDAPRLREASRLSLNESL